VATKTKTKKTAANGNHEIEYWTPDDLQPYARNPNIHPVEQIQLICDSIEQFGFTTPILTDEKGMILAGHGRQLAAMQLQLSHVPVIRLKGLSEAQKRAYIMADNQIARTSDFNFDLIAAELKSIADEYPDFELSVIGFAATDLAKFLDPLFGKQHPDTGKLLEVLRVSFDDPKHKVERGQIWDCIDHAVCCMDVFDEWENWKDELQPGSVFLPYAGPLVLLGERAKTTRFVIVNPQEFICSLILDKFVEAKLGIPTLRK